MHPFVWESTTTSSSRFDSKEIRLLCSLDRKLSVINSVPLEQQQRPEADGVTGKVQLTAPEYSVANDGVGFPIAALLVVMTSWSSLRPLIAVCSCGPSPKDMEVKLLTSFFCPELCISIVLFLRLVVNQFFTLASGDNSWVIKLWPSSSSIRWVTCDC